MSEHTLRRLVSRAHGSWWLVILVVASLISLPARAEDTLRIGLLRFGTASWEIDVMKHHALDRKHGLAIVVRELASNEAAKIALHTRAVDMIVSDWIWVQRQRASGEDLSFIPYSNAVGSLMLPKQSRITRLADLRGARIGVAGGALDKSWLLLDALSRRQLGQAMADIAEPVFGAPPLLNAEFERGRLDAVLTYWHYAAPLEARGARELISVSQIIRHLGIGAAAPMLGFVMHEQWARDHAGPVRRFVAASHEAKALLASSDAEWRRLAPYTGTTDPAVLKALQRGYRSGIPARWGSAERRAAVALHRILADIGGTELVGASRTFDEHTFWPDVAY